MKYTEKVRCFDSIRVKPLEYRGKSIRGTVSFLSGSTEESFELIFTYSDHVDADENLAGMLLTMAAINFTYFSGSLVLEFPVSENDLEIIRKYVRINNTEVFVNKLCRRRFEFVKKEYLPEEADITEENARGSTEIIAPSRKNKESRVTFKPGNSVAVLSSGGKESLLTYGMLRESGADTYAFFFNESGGHWLTAKTSYEYYSANFKNVKKVWSNIDRFYRWAQLRLKILDFAVVNKRADDYPIQLFTFPVYVFSFIPMIRSYSISGLLLGDELDDPREMPGYKGIKHYYGVFDQTWDFNNMTSAYLQSKGINSSLWSAVYPVFGSIVEKILVNRYHDLYLLQRSCHSCHYSKGKIIPCGQCTKCMGILLFVKYAGGKTGEIGYSIEDGALIIEKAEKVRMRIDPDEMEFLELYISGRPIPDNLSHVEGIHVLPWEDGRLSLVPENFRKSIGNILEKYTKGTYMLKENAWERSA